jgi:chorismate-pyruvate lyase
MHTRIELRGMWLASALLLAPFSAGAAVPALNWPGTVQGRLAADAALHALNDQLLANDSATLVLDDWCATHRMAATPKIVAERIRGANRDAPEDVRALLKVGPGDEVRYRHVRLRCGTHVLSDADNWYVPGRLTAEINRQLDTTDIPFGRATRPLQFRRFTVGSNHRWSPLPIDWQTLPARRWPRQLSLDVPETVLENRAVLLLPSGEPISAVVERYTREILNFAAPPVAR